jgi:hypothetical protein
MDKRLGGFQCRFGHDGEQKNSQPLPGLEPPIIQPAAQRYTTELSRLLHYCLLGILFFKVPQNMVSRPRHYVCDILYILLKVKVKFSLCLCMHHAMETYWGSGGIAPRILDRGTRRR